MKKLIASVFFPGLGHLLAGRHLKGAILALLFSITLQALLAGLIWPELLAHARTPLAALALGIWLYALLSLWWLIRRTDRARSDGRADQVLLAGVKAMLAGDLKTADETFRKLLKLDDRDLEGWLYLARTCQLRGQPARARTLFRVVEHLDLDRKWSRQIDILCHGKRFGTPDITS